MSFVIRPAMVRKSVTDLVSAHIHEHFAGYLCVVRTAARDGRTDGLRPSFSEFFDEFLRVPGAPAGRPYLRPFNRAGSIELAWNQANVAGSYAPSSIRPASVFARIVRVDGQGSSATYSLGESHAQLALEQLAGGNHIPAAALAAFLYRDYAFEAHTQPTLSDLMQVFRYEFGYEDEQGATSADWQTLYTEDSALGSDELFEQAS